MWRRIKRVIGPLVLLVLVTSVKCFPRRLRARRTSTYGSKGFLPDRGGYRNGEILGSLVTRVDRTESGTSWFSKSLRLTVREIQRGSGHVVFGVDQSDSQVEIYGRLVIVGRPWTTLISGTRVPVSRQSGRTSGVTSNHGGTCTHMCVCGEMCLSSTSYCVLLLGSRLSQPLGTSEDYRVPIMTDPVCGEVSVVCHGFTRESQEPIL